MRDAVDIDILAFQPQFLVPLMGDPYVHADVRSTFQVNGEFIVLFRIRFEALEVGVTPMVIAFSDIRDHTNASIPHNILNTTVVIDSPIPVEAATWGGVKALYQ